MKEELKYASTRLGAQCATTAGIIEMQMQCVVSLDTYNKVMQSDNHQLSIHT